LIAQRLRQHPRDFGRAATYVETTELPEIGELSERFLRAIDYYGLVEIEFKQDPRDKKFKLLDVNARTWGFHALGGAAGVDFPYLQYADQVGEPIGGFNAKPGVGWLRLVTDLPTAALDLCKGNLGLRTYWASLRNTRVESVFAADDFAPSMAEMTMLPYFVGTKYFAKPTAKGKEHAATNRVPAKMSASESW
jgi:D-aspartate ligase